MTVQRKKGGAIHLVGRCGAEDAEVLQRHLLAAPKAIVQWTRCEYLHPAVVQVLLVAGVRVRGTPENAFLRVHLAPLLQRSAKGNANVSASAMPRPPAEGKHG
jgi:hypothetical protein